MKHLIPVFALLVSGLAVADATTDKIGAAVTAITGITQIQSVKKLPQADLYEVRAQGTMFYVNKDADWVVMGSLFDANTKENITQTSMAALQQFKWADVPLDKAIKIVRGKGERKMITFEDPNCGYCKKLAGDLDTIPNVTIYVMPLAMLSQDSHTKVTNILCASNPAAAWQDAMHDKPVPECTNATRKEQATKRMAEVQKVATKYVVNGTPTVFYQANNHRANGYEPAAAIEGRLVTAR